MTTDDPITDLDLLAYADGRLDSGRAARVQAYLAERPALRAQIDDFAQQNAELHACFDRYAEAEIPEHMRALLQGVRERQRPRSRSPAAAVQVAAAVVLMLAAGAGGWYAGSGGVRPGGGDDDLVATTANLHDRQPVAEPVTTADPQATASLESLRERAALPDRAPELRQHGYRLMRVEQVDMEGTRGVVLHYAGRGEERVDVVLRPRWETADARVRTTMRGDVGLAHWQEGPLAVALAGPQDERQLRELAQALRRALQTPEPTAPSDIRPDEPSLQRDQEVRAAEDPDTMVLSPRLSPQPAAIGDNVQP